MRTTFSRADTVCSMQKIQPLDEIYNSLKNTYFVEIKKLNMIIFITLFNKLRLF